MQQLNEKQALEIIKAILDLSTQKGVFSKIEESYTAIQAYNILAEKLKDDENNAAAN